MKTVLFVVAALLTLSGCEQQTPENAETEKRIATCQEVMKLYMTQATVYERDRKRLLGSCHIAQSKRTLEQWQCTLKEMQTGEKFKNSSDKCGATDATLPQ
jgi:hypothetical protein